MSVWADTACGLGAAADSGGQEHQRGGEPGQTLQLPAFLSVHVHTEWPALFLVGNKEQLTVKLSNVRIQQAAIGYHICSGSCKKTNKGKQTVHVKHFSTS